MYYFLHVRIQSPLWLPYWFCLLLQVDVMGANCWANTLQISDFPPNILLVLPKDVQQAVFLLVAEQGGDYNWALFMLF